MRVVPSQMLLAGVLVIFAAASQAQICATSLPPTNGCSTQGLEYLSPDLAVWKGTFNSACNSHDICYGTLGTAKASCDSSFLSAMRSKCDSQFNRWLFPAEWAACRSAAGGFYEAVRSYGDPYYVDGQQVSANRSYAVAQSIEAAVCGTTPERQQIYSSGTLSYVRTSFSTYARRSPSNYEFFAAINREDPAGPQDLWRSGVDSYARSVAGLTPPAAAYSKSKTLSSVTYTASPTIPGTSYEWHINGTVTMGSTVRMPLPLFSMEDVTIYHRGFLVANRSGLKEMAILDEKFVIQGECPAPNPCP